MKKIKGIDIVNIQIEDFCKEKIEKELKSIRNKKQKISILLQYQKAWNIRKDYHRYERGIPLKFNNWIKIKLNELDFEVKNNSNDGTEKLVWIGKREDLIWLIDQLILNQLLVEPDHKDNVISEHFVWKDKETIEPRNLQKTRSNMKNIGTNKYSLKAENLLKEIKNKI